MTTIIGISLGHILFWRMLIIFLSTKQYEKTITVLYCVKMCCSILVITSEGKRLPTKQHKTTTSETTRTAGVVVVVVVFHIVMTDRNIIICMSIHHQLSASDII
jgi:hypothetical protein